MRRASVLVAVTVLVAGVIGVAVAVYGEGVGPGGVVHAATQETEPFATGAIAVDPSILGDNGLVLVSSIDPFRDVVPGRGFEDIDETLNITGILDIVLAADEFGCTPGAGIGIRLALIGTYTPGVDDWRRGLLSLRGSGSFIS